MISFQNATQSFINNKHDKSQAVPYLNALYKVRCGYEWSY